MHNLSLLYVEDEKEIREAFLSIFKRSFCNVYEAQDGEEAYNLYLEKKPDIIVSDITMPIMDGIELTKKIREDDKETQIILLTALDTKETLLEAIPLKLFEYIIKPIDNNKLQQLLNKCVDIINSSKKDFIEINKIFSYSDITKELFEKERKIKLSKNEIKLVEVFLKNKEKVFSSEELFDLIWDDYDYSMTKLRSLINRLNSKSTNKIIESVYGVGYKIAKHGK